MTSIGTGNSIAKWHNSAMLTGEFWRPPSCQGWETLTEPLKYNQQNTERFCYPKISGMPSSYIILRENFNFTIRLQTLSAHIIQLHTWLLWTSPPLWGAKQTERGLNLKQCLHHYNFYLNRDSLISKQESAIILTTSFVICILFHLNTTLLPTMASFLKLSLHLA